MAISIIIPTKDRQAILAETIRHIYTIYNPVVENIEVIIVNDGAQQLDYLLQKYKNLRITKNKHNGAACARNTGAGMATHELLLFLDDDIGIRPGCIEKHVELHRQYARALVSGSWDYTLDTITLLNRSAFGRYKLKNDYQILQGYHKNKLSEGIYKAISLASFNLSVLHSDFEELKGFNEAFPYAGCEDQEITMRAREKGFMLIVDATNISSHDDTDRATDRKKWLNRQYTGVQGYPLLCDLFPYRKKEPLFFENTPIAANDKLRLKIKKCTKHLLSLPVFLYLLNVVTAFAEQIRLGDKILFKLYNILCGLNIYKGFRLSYDALQKHTGNKKSPPLSE